MTMHYKTFGFERTACGVVADSSTDWTDHWAAVNCNACLGTAPLDKSQQELPDEEHASFTIKTAQAKRVATLSIKWLEEFAKKSEDYQTSTGNVSENFGLMGQYMKLTDKVHKLRKVMWDNEIKAQAGVGVNPGDFNFESTEEILRDVIGHCFLALDFLEQRGKL